MFKNHLPESKRLELEDKVDYFLQKKGLPHPRIEPDFVNIPKEEKKYVKTIISLFKAKNLKFKKEFIKKTQFPAWIQTIDLDDQQVLLELIFYNSDHPILIHSSKDLAEYIYIHELTHLKHFNSSEISRMLHGTNFDIENKTFVNCFVEGFAEYVSLNIKRDYFKNNRKMDYLLLKNSIKILDKKNPQYNFQTFKKEVLNTKPYIAGFLLFSMLDYEGLENEIKELITNPLNKNVNINNKGSIIKAVNNYELFKLKKDEFYKPHLYIKRIKK